MPSKDLTAGYKRTVSSASAARAPLLMNEGINYVSEHMDHTEHKYMPAASNAGRASRIMTTVRRSVGSFPKKRGTEPTKLSSYGVISTPAERTLPTSTRYRDHTQSRPTIEQIAMGLHTSRTPHLRSRLRPTTSVTDSQTRHSSSPLVLSSAPARPALKSSLLTTPKMSSSFPASASSSTVASNSAPPTKIQPTPNTLSSIKVKVACFLPRSRNSSAPPSIISSTLSSPRTSSEAQVPRKTVRFSAGKGDLPPTKT